MILYSAIGVGMILALVCASMYYFRYSRSRRIVSITDWVKLMRENDLKIERTSSRKATNRIRPES